MKGRPRLSPKDQTVWMTTRVPKTVYDAIYRVAHRRGATISMVTRAALRSFVIRDMNRDTKIDSPSK